MRNEVLTRELFVDGSEDHISINVSASLAVIFSSLKLTAFSMSEEVLYQYQKVCILVNALSLQGLLQGLLISVPRTSAQENVTIGKKV